MYNGGICYVKYCCVLRVKENTKLLSIFVLLVLILYTEPKSVYLTYLLSDQSSDCIYIEESVH
jgi:hypothetical protein